MCAWDRRRDNKSFILQNQNKMIQNKLIHISLLQPAPADLQYESQGLMTQNNDIYKGDPPSL